jgi:sugar/nucleoside kinase (ribokinase family)
VASPVLNVGILVADIFVPPIERLPAAGELVSTEEFLVQPGGCAANTAIVLGRLGVRASVVGRVGDDLFGELVLGYLQERGVDTSAALRTAGRGTSKTVALSVVGDDRRFIHTFGANGSLTARDVSDEALGAAKVVHVGGYLVLPGLEQSALAERFRHARASGAQTVLDVVVPYEHEHLTLDAVGELLPVADYFLPNEDEARALTGERDVRAQAERIAGAGARTVVIKRGADGAYVRSGDTVFELPAPPVEAVEPSGAGDAFAAGLIVGILEGWSLERSVRYASVVGASACTALGCYAGAFTREQADAFLAAHPDWAADDAGTA